MEEIGTVGKWLITDDFWTNSYCFHEEEKNRILSSFYEANITLISGCIHKKENKMKNFYKYRWKRLQSL